MKRPVIKGVLMEPADFCRLDDVNLPVRRFEFAGSGIHEPSSKRLLIPAETCQFASVGEHIANRKKVSASRVMPASQSEEFHRD